MLLEEHNVCCICYGSVHFKVKGLPAYYCGSCYRAYKDDIVTKDKPLWLKTLFNEERRRRRKRNLLRKQNRLIQWERLGDFYGA